MNKLSEITADCVLFNLLAEKLQTIKITERLTRNICERYIELSIIYDAAVKDCKRMEKRIKKLLDTVNPLGPQKIKKRNDSRMNCLNSARIGFLQVKQN